MDHPKTITHISLCAGYGGIDLGLRECVTALRTVAFSEIEAFACANLVAKMEAGHLDCAPVWTDLRTFPWEEFSGKVDILSGGFPCQPFSLAGDRAGDEDPRHLFPHIKRGISILRPSVVFLENVEGIISSKLSGEWIDPIGTPVLLHVLRELERLGYKATAGVFSAGEIGAPHRRKRAFILAVLGNPSDLRCSLFGQDNGKNSGDSRSKKCGLHESQRAGSLPSNDAQQKAFPSRPGEPQYQWEPPRVVGNSELTGLERGTICQHEGSEIPSEGCEDVADPEGGRINVGSEGEWETQPARTSEGLAHPIHQGDGGRSGESSRNGGEWSGGKASLPSGGSQDWTALISSPKSSMGGNLNGSAGRMGYAELCISNDNRSDELRLLGNGVVPDTATLAFVTLFNSIVQP